MPAPPRFLPEYDNLLLSHKDRTRVILDNRSVPLPPGNGATAGTFLADGMWQGSWKIRDQTLRILPFTKLRRADREALLTEAAQLCAFVAPKRSTTSSSTNRRSLAGSSVVADPPRRAAVPALRTDALTDTLDQRRTTSAR